jgi:hypothetical protein
MWSPLLCTRHKCTFLPSFMSACLPPCPSARLPVCPSARLPVCPSAHPPLSFLQDLRLFRAHESAYAKIQGTKPQTLAYALHDSPVGLAAWILEKFRTWSDCGGVPDGAFSKDELLTNVCLYWCGVDGGGHAGVHVGDMLECVQASRPEGLSHEVLLTDGSSLHSQTCYSAILSISSKSRLLRHSCPYAHPRPLRIGKLCCSFRILAHPTLALCPHVCAPVRPCDTLPLSSAGVYHQVWWPHRVIDAPVQGNTGEQVCREGMWTGKGGQGL